MPPTASATTDTDMAVRAAWMHFAGGYTQAEVADRLGLSKLKAHRLITRANREGMVQVYVDGDVSECLELEKQLSGLFDLSYCEVIPDFDRDPLPLKALGIAGGQYLRRLLNGSTVDSVGICHGRTLAACVEHIPHTRNAEVQFVSLLGGFSKKFSANPHDVIHRLAERTGAQAYVMPVPFLADTVQDHDVLMSQRGLKEVIEKARCTPLKVVGIGAVSHDASLVATGMIDESEFSLVSDAGGVGELLGHYFTESGDPAKTTLSDRTMGLAVDDLHDGEIIAVAGGKNKSAAIAAVLNSRLLSGLITDEHTARMLV